ncbi:hypothetical protein IQ238_26205 [Pleurocapsales cyanobacterium LEGE 06147]|nr:hypothetical protein [Pleurocapsales cyanobacterium LEGE 06147]
MPSVESSISIPCLVKQPKQPEVKGVIKQDLGGAAALAERDRFSVYIPHLDKSITVSKLFVYPDLGKSVDELLQGGLNKCSSKNNADFLEKVSDTSDKCSSKITPPSTNCSSKTRRKKGEGSGHIYYRTVTRNGKEYRQAYYQWRENGKQRTKYIPKKLLDKVEKAEHQRYPVADILELLQGGLKNCSSKKFDTFSSGEVLTAKTTANCSSKITSPPSTKRKRSSGYGGGYIEYREVKRNQKTYSQYWYHYEFWLGGDRLTKKSRYIPKRLVARVEKLESEKVPVEEILKVLRNKGRKK